MGVKVGDAVEVAVAVSVGVGVCVCVAVAVGVFVRVALAVGVGVFVRVVVAVAVDVLVCVRVSVAVGVLVAVGGRAPSLLLPQADNTSRPPLTTKAANKRWGFIVRVSFTVNLVVMVGLLLGFVEEVVGGVGHQRLAADVG
ncbi:MAG: hypothetical protein LAO77_18670 [Acidobacteriia bacterium]|nr:hypothetical protein [Terriglobia bacterium]